MPIFYRGAGVGTYWHTNDPRHTGFTPHSPGVLATVDRLMQHIASGTTTSPFVSLTRSFGVAVDYARRGPSQPSKRTPAFVWEIELPAELPLGYQLLDPLKLIAHALPDPLAANYQHDGIPQVLLGLIDPNKHRGSLRRVIPRPPGSSGPLKAANLSTELIAMVYALRDAEALFVGTIPAAWIRFCHKVQ